MKYPSQRDPNECLPTWHTAIAAAQVNRFKVSTSSNPLKAAEEASAAMGRKISIGTYTLARMIASEAAGLHMRANEPCRDVPEPAAGSPEEKVALAHAVMNYIKFKYPNDDFDSAIFKLLCPHGYFGEYGEASNYASTKLVPHNDDILAVEVARHTPDTTRGARYWISVRCPQWKSLIEKRQAGGYTWIGPIPGVSSRLQQLFVNDDSISEAVRNAQVAAQYEAYDTLSYPLPTRICGTTEATIRGTEPLRELPKKVVNKRFYYGLIATVLMVGGAWMANRFYRKYF